MVCDAHGFFGDVEAYACYLKEDAAGLDACNPIFGVTFSFPHTHFCWLLGDGYVGEGAKPYLSFSLHRTGDDHTDGFYLSGGDTSRLQYLKGEVSEGDAVSALGDAFDASFLYFSIFYSFRL